MILLDANILVFATQAASPNHQAVTQRLAQFVTENEDIAVCPQVLYEFYVTATRPATSRNGLGLSSDDAMTLVDSIKSTYTFIDDPVNLFGEWQSIITKYKTIGKQAHDARLVALMQAQAIDTIYTMNPGDFNRYTDIITVLN
jgi:predicted nucleic acid-binding protein